MRKKYNPVLEHKGHPKKNIPGPFGIHKGKQICLKCNCFVRWLGKDFFYTTDRTNINNNNNIITTNNYVIKSVLISDEQTDNHNDQSLRDSFGKPQEEVELLDSRVIVNSRKEEILQ